MSNVVDISGRLPRQAKRTRLPRVYKPWMLKHLIETHKSDDEPVSEWLERRREQRRIF
jgi:hypothetical protein